MSGPGVLTARGYPASTRRTPFSPSILYFLSDTPLTCSLRHHQQHQELALQPSGSRAQKWNTCSFAAHEQTGQPSKLVFEASLPLAGPKDAVISKRLLDAIATNSKLSPSQRVKAIVGALRQRSFLQLDLSLASSATGETLLISICGGIWRTHIQRWITKLESVLDHLQLLICEMPVFVKYAL